MSKLNRFKGLAGRAFDGRAAEVAPEPGAAVEMAQRAQGERLPGARLVPLGAVHPDPDQPRKTFDARAIDELAASIREHGILQPIVVSRSDDEDAYTIVAGERRFRAARVAGLDKVPVIVVAPMDATTRVERQLVENLQREGITPLEEFEAVEALRSRVGLTHQQIADRLGKNRTYVTKTLSLRKIPDDIRREIGARGVAAREPLLLLAQQPSESDMRRLLAKMNTSEGDVRSLRKSSTATKPAPRTGALITLRAEASKATVTIKFRRARATGDDVIAALEEALEDARARRKTIGT